MTRKFKMTSNERKLKTNSQKTINRSNNFLYGFQENETKRAAQPSFSSKKRKKKKKKKKGKKQRSSRKEKVRKMKP